MMDISIIIPTLNEADNLRQLIPLLQDAPSPGKTEIIVVDGQSSDRTVAVAESLGARTLLCAPGRARQMNQGAAMARGELLYFVHADTRPPRSCLQDIAAAARAGYPIGSFRFRFDDKRWLLRFNAFFTRFDFRWCRGGDQSIFVTRQVFEQFGGYREHFVAMEEYDLMDRIRQEHPFRIIPKEVIVSARKYRENSWFRVQWANFVVFRKYRQGVHPEQLYRTYRQLLNHRS